jgi:hypothetical protein
MLRTMLTILLDISDEYPHAGDAFTADLERVSIALFVLIVGVAFVATNWWRAGRDRVYSSYLHMSEEAESPERRRPIHYRPTVVVEYTPPGNLRPAQVGVLLNERPGSREFTATYADLAARGYMAIEELPRGGEGRRPAWRVRRTRGSEGLLDYEATLLDALFAQGDERTLTFADSEHYIAMRRAESQLLENAVASGFFPVHAENVRKRWVYISALTAAVGVVSVFVLGGIAQMAIVGLAVIAVGLLLFCTHTWMPRRTAHGSEMLRRCLGFKLYVEQGESARHKFNEDQAIFAKYLGYAIVFGVANKWAAAFNQVNTTNIMHVFVPEPKRSFADVLFTPNWLG